MTITDRERAEARLIAWREEYAKRDQLVVDAASAGISRRRISILTGIARTTINRILESPK